jgi:CHAT domain-containing protein
LHLLLVVNPTGDLSGAEAEGARIRELFGSHPGVNIVERHQQEATKAVLRDDFCSGQYDVIHYAGHAYFDSVHPARSGLLCAGQEVLSGMDLAGLGPLPSLIFFNACEAARIRRGSAIPHKRLPLRRRVEQNVGLAEAFLRGGAANYVGTYWPVGDAAANTFAEVFYTAVMNGQALGPAISAARRAVQKIQSIDWADYILYGSADFVLKEKD